MGAAHQQRRAAVGGLGARGRVDVVGDRLEVAGAGQHRPVVAGSGVLGHRDHTTTGRCRPHGRGGGSASVASRTSIPVICSRSTMIERICASTTSAERSATRSTSAVPAPIRSSDSAHLAAPSRRSPARRPSRRRRPRGPRTAGCRAPGSARGGSSRPRSAAPAPGCCASPGRAARRARPSGARRPPCRRRNGDEAITESPSSAASCSSRISRSVFRASASTCSPRSTSPSWAVCAPAASSSAMRRTTTAACCARTPQRRTGDHGRGDQRDRTADQRVHPAGQRVAGRRGERHHDDALHGGLGHEQRAGVEQQRHRHRQRDQHRHLPRAGADHQQQQVGEEHPDGHADRDLRDPPQPLPVGRARGTPPRRWARRTAAGGRPPRGR